MAMDNGGRGCEEAERLMTRRRELWTCGKKFTGRKNPEKWKMAMLQNPRKQQRLVGNLCAEVLS